jgi:hypothetical protein
MSLGLDRQHTLDLVDAFLHEHSVVFVELNAGVVARESTYTANLKWVYGHRPALSIRERAKIDLHASLP